MEKAIKILKIIILCLRFYNSKYHNVEILRVQLHYGGKYYSMISVYKKYRKKNKTP